MENLTRCPMCQRILQNDFQSFRVNGQIREINEKNCVSSGNHAFIYLIDANMEKAYSLLVTFFPSKSGLIWEFEKRKLTYSNNIVGAAPGTRIEYFEPDFNNFQHTLDKAKLYVNFI